jgi:hypothetical protein
LLFSTDDFSDSVQDIGEPGDSEDEDESFIQVPKVAQKQQKRTTPSVSSLSDKENSLKQRPRATTKTKSKKKQRADSSSSSRPKKKRAKRKQPQQDQDISDDNSSVSKPTKSVLSEQSQQNLSSRRINYSEEMSGNTGSSRKRTVQDISASDDSVDSGSNLDLPERYKMDDHDVNVRLEAQMLVKNNKIKHMRGVIKDLKSEKLKLKEFGDRLESDKVELKERSDRLEVRVVELEEAALNPPLGVAENEGFRPLVQAATKGFIWNRNQFIANPSEMDRIMLQIMLSTVYGRELLEGLSEQEKKKLVTSHALTYGKKYINPMINQKRSVTQTALWKAVAKRTAAGKKIPSTATMLQIIRRKGLEYIIHEENTEPTPENIRQVDEWREIFDWYVGDLVSKVTGTKNWGDQKFHGHISTYAPPDDKTTPYVSAGAEAFVQLMFENCDIKWGYMIRCIQNGVAINDKSVKMDKNVFSDRCSGQNEYGGWSDKGRVRYKELRDQITK